MLNITKIFVFLVSFAKNIFFEMFFELPPDLFGE